MQPEVISGPRTPGGVRKESGARPRTGGPGVIPEGKTVFQFVAGKYRVQLTSPEEIRRSDGTYRRDKALVVVANEFFAFLDNVKDAETIARLKGGKARVKNAEGKEVEVEFEPHAYYGRDFWDFSDTLKAIQEKRETEALKVLEDPSARARIIAELQAQGVSFQLPREPQLTETRSEPGELAEEGAE